MKASKDTLKQLKAIQGSLSAKATKDEDARRRYTDRDEDAWMFGFGSPYALDIDKGYSCKAIRRLGKTQVVISPKNVHARNRMVHSLEVAAICRLIARILGLNEHLCMAGSMLHDIGHTPFGHHGEKFLGKKAGINFRHEVFGPIVLQLIERKGMGLNLTIQTLEVIRWHSRGKGALKPSGISQEADATMNSDKISYTFADYSDIFGRKAYGQATPRLEDFPGLSEQMNWFGRSQRERVEKAVTALCLESAEEGQVSFIKSEAAIRFAEAKKIMYQVYPRLYPRDNYGLMNLVYESLSDAVPDADATVVFALMGDQDVLWLLEKVCCGQMLSRDMLSQLAIADTLPYIASCSFDLTDPGLDW